MTEDANPPRRARGRPRLPPEEKKRHNITFRIRTDLRDTIEERAKSEGRSISEEIENILEKHISISIYNQLQRDNLFSNRDEMGDELMVVAAEADIYKRIDKITSLLIDDLILFRLTNLIGYDTEMMSKIKDTVINLNECSNISKNRWMSRMEFIAELISKTSIKNRKDDNE